MAKMILREYLSEHGIRSNYVYTKAGMNQSSFSRLMTNTCEGIRFDYLQKICDVLKCDISDILILENSNTQTEVDSIKESI